MNQSGNTSGTGLFWFLTAVRSSKTTAIVDLKGKDQFLLFVSDGAVILVESTNPASSFPAFLIGQGRVGKEDVMKSMEHATSAGIPLPAALTQVTAMTQKEVMQGLRDHAMLLLTQIFNGVDFQYTIHLSGKPKAALPFMKIPVIFPFLKAQMERELPDGEMRKQISVFDELLTPTPHYGPLLGGVIASLATPSAQALAKALGKGPITLTDLVAKGCDAEEIFQAAKALIECKLAFFPPRQETIAQWGYVANMGAGFSMGPGAPLSTGGDHTMKASSPSQPTQQRRPSALSAGTGAGDTAVEEALREALEKFEGADHFFGAIGMLPDHSRAALEERLDTLDGKYAAENYAGFMLSADGAQMLARIQEMLGDMRVTFASPEAREAYHEKMGIKDDDLRVPLAALNEAETMAKSAQERAEIEAYTEAVTLLEQAVELAPHDAHRITEKALFIFEHIQNENLNPEEFAPEVDAALAKAIATQSNSAIPFRVKAMIMEARKRPADALESYQKALEMNSRDAESRDGIRRMRRELAESSENAAGGDDGGDNVVSKLSGMLFRRT